MALVNCTECGHDISTKAKTCPACGARRPFNWKIARRIIYVVVALVVADGAITLTMLALDKRKIQECWDHVNSVDAEQGTGSIAAECNLLEYDFEREWGSKPL